MNDGVLGEKESTKGGADLRQEDKEWGWDRIGFRHSERHLSGDDGK